MKSAVKLAVQVLKPGRRWPVAQLRHPGTEEVLAHRACACAAHDHQEKNLVGLAEQSKAGGWEPQNAGNKYRQPSACQIFLQN